MAPPPTIPPSSPCASDRSLRDPGALLRRRRRENCSASSSRRSASPSPCAVSSAQLDPRIARTAGRAPGRASPRGRDPERRLAHPWALRGQPTIKPYDDDAGSRWPDARKAPTSPRRVSRARRAVVLPAVLRPEGVVARFSTRVEAPVALDAVLALSAWHHGTTFAQSAAAVAGGLDRALREPGWSSSACRSWACVHYARGARRSGERRGRQRCARDGAPAALQLSTRRTWSSGQAGAASLGSPVRIGDRAGIHSIGPDRYSVKVSMLAQVIRAPQVPLTPRPSASGASAAPDTPDRSPVHARGTSWYPARVGAVECLLPRWIRGSSS
jgi:hypothetical protein